MSTDYRHLKGQQRCDAMHYALPDYARGQASPDLAAWIDANIDACPACKTELAELRQLFAEIDKQSDVAFASPDAAYFASFSARVNEKLAAKAAKRELSVWQRFFANTAAVQYASSLAGFMLIASLIVFGAKRLNTIDTPETPSESVNFERLVIERLSEQSFFSNIGNAENMLAGLNEDEREIFSNNLSDISSSYNFQNQSSEPYAVLDDDEVETLLNSI
jgi:hypothetical protein